MIEVTNLHEAYSIEKLDNLRERIDSVDERIAELFCERLQICGEIAAYKRMHSMPIESPAREKEIVAARCGEHPDLEWEIAALFRTLFEISKSFQHSKLNLYLVGMPHCGKTRFGRKLSMLLDRPLADTDEMVMQEQDMTIDDIFDKYGEAYFREMEHNELMKVAAMGGLVVSTGGGVLTNPNNIKLIKHSGKVVFLNRKLENLLGANPLNRPLLREGDSTIIRLYNERIGTYMEYADFIIDPDEVNAVEQICKYFVEAIGYNT